MNKDLLKHLLKVAIAVSLLGGCFYFLDFTAVVDVLRSTDPTVYAWTLLITFIGTIVLPAVVTWRSLQISSISIPLLKLVEINLAVRFYMLVLPRAVGMAIRWYRYQKAGSGYDAVALMGFERVVQLLVVTFVASVALYLDRELAGDLAWPLLLVCVGVTAAFLVLLLLYISPAFTRFVDRYLLWMVRLLPTAIESKVNKLWQAILAFHAIPKLVILQLFAISLCGYFLFILASWVLADGMGLSLSLISLIWIRSLVFFITLVPLSIGGIGLREVGFIYFLSFAGIAEEQAFAYSLAMLGLQLLIGLIGAALDIYRVVIQGDKLGVGTKKNAENGSTG